MAIVFSVSVLAFRFHILDRCHILRFKTVNKSLIGKLQILGIYFVPKEKKTAAAAQKSELPGMSLRLLMIHVYSIL